MIFLIFKTSLSSQKTIYFKGFLVNFFGNIFSRKFPIELPNDQSCHIHVFYKGKLQSLTKKGFIVAIKILAYFDQYNYIK